MGYPIAKLLGRVLETVDWMSELDLPFRTGLTLSEEKTVFKPHRMKKAKDWLS